jgi:hypothetical protein
MLFENSYVRWLSKSQLSKRQKKQIDMRSPPFDPHCCPVRDLAAAVFPPIIILKFFFISAKESVMSI